MRIVFGGQLDRVFSNEIAIAGGLDHGNNLDPIAIEARRRLDARYFQLAGTIAALSEQIITLPYIRFGGELDDDTPSALGVSAVGESTRGVGSVADFDEMTEDALDLTRACGVFVGLASSSNAVLGEIDEDEAWVGRYHALLELHSQYGAPHVYLCGLLLRSVLAWESDAVFVLAGCDRSILADLGNLIVGNRWPRPFAIPDLRSFESSPNSQMSGPLINLQPENLSAVDAISVQPGIPAYAEAVAHLILHAETENIDAALTTANRLARENAPNLRDAQMNITLTAGCVSMFNNDEAVVHNPQSTLAEWSRRRFPSRMLRTVVLD